MNNFNETKLKYDYAKSDYFLQNKKCKVIKIHLEEMIETKSAFQNVLLILNNEVLNLSALISKEKEKEKNKKIPPKVYEKNQSIIENKKNNYNISAVLKTDNENLINDVKNIEKSKFIFYRKL